MLVKDAVKQGINHDGWYDLDENGFLSVYIEDGRVVRGTAHDGIGIRTTYPYRKIGLNEYTSACREYELADLLTGKIVMM